MLSIQSPQYSGKVENLTSKLSPSFRNKRIPSAQDNYSCSSNQNLKISKTQSPSKFSEQVRRRKSQYAESNITNRRKVKANSIQNTNTNTNNNNNNVNIMTSINNLKQQYKSLKQAYKELIQQRIKNTEQIKNYKFQNQRLKNQFLKSQKQTEKYKNRMIVLENQNERCKRQYDKFIEAEKFKAKKLEESLQQKEFYIKNTIMKMNEDEEEISKHTVAQFKSSFPKIQNEDNSLTISHQKFSNTNEKLFNNQSQFLSFSLTSVMEESLYKEPTIRRSKQNLKVLAEVTQQNNQMADQCKFSEPKTAKSKDTNHNFKKVRKQIASKLEPMNDIKQSKQNLLSGHCINPKTPVNNGEKKTFKSKISKSTNKKNQEDKQNTDLKNQKKKSKKLINMSSNQ